MVSTAAPARFQKAEGPVSRLVIEELSNPVDPDQRQLRVVRGFGYANIGVRGLNAAFRRRYVRTALQNLRRQTDWHGRRFHSADSTEE